MQAKRGFTLMELLLVLSIIAVSIAISSPNFKNLLKNSAQELIKSKLIFAITSALQIANLKQTTVVLCPSNTPNKCTAEWKNNLSVFAIAKSNLRTLKYIKNFNLGYSKGTLHWRAYPLQHNYLLIHPDTILQNTNGTFWWCEPASMNPQWAIRINKSSRVSVISPDATGHILDSHGKALRC